MQDKLLKPQNFLKKHKDKIYFFIYISASFLLCWWAWSSLRPKIIISGCSEIALKVSQVEARTKFDTTVSDSYENALNNCLIELGISPLSN